MAIYTVKEGMTQADLADLLYAMHFPAGEGVVDANGFTGLKVAQNGTPNLTVQVAAGAGLIKNASWVEGSDLAKLWPFYNDATVSVAIDANASGNPRIDIIIAQYDTAASPNAEATNVVTITKVTGTPAASPSAPALPSNALLLAEVSVPNGDTTISDNQITDKRVRAAIHPAMLNVPDGTLINGKIAVSVATNDLTVAIKTKTGKDPSTRDPVGVMIDGAMRMITSALSVTRNDGTNWGNAGGPNTGAVEMDWFVYLAWDVVDNVVRLGFSRFPHARLYSDFSGTTTNQLYGAFDTNPDATNVVEVIGRFAATLSLSGTGHLWTVPSFTAANLIQYPIRTTRWLTWTPSFGGFSVAPANGIYTYKIDDLEVVLDWTMPTNGTSNANNFTISSPVDSRTIANWTTYVPVHIQDNSTSATNPGRATIGSNSNTIDVAKDWTNPGWTTSNGKRASGRMSYRYA